MPAEPAKPAQPRKPFQRRPTLPVNPRRVRGGVKLSRAELAYPECPAAQGWLDLALASASEQVRADALEYARAGQVKGLDLGPGHVAAAVQGRAPGPYKVRLAFDLIDEDVWVRAIEAMGEQARFAASLISGRLTNDVMTLFDSLDAPLTPESIAPSCTCAAGDGGGDGDGSWCKHALCLAMVTADRLAAEPLVVFLLRGMPALELIERLHDKRSAHFDLASPMPAYSPVVRGASDIVFAPLEECVGEFWDAPTDPRELDLPVQPPEVSHPLLRRLGPSPFKDGRFPLVGLLASCYESISEAVLREERGVNGDGGEDGDSGEDGDGGNGDGGNGDGEDD